MGSATGRARTSDATRASPTTNDLQGPGGLKNGARRSSAVIVTCWNLGLCTHVCFLFFSKWFMGWLNNEVY